MTRARSCNRNLSSSKNAALLPITLDSSNSISFSSCSGFFGIELCPLFCLSFTRTHNETPSILLLFFSFVCDDLKFSTLNLFNSSLFYPKELISLFFEHKQMFPFLLTSQIQFEYCPFTETRILRYNWYFNAKQSIHTWPNRLNVTLL